MVIELQKANEIRDSLLSGFQEAIAGCERKGWQCGCGAIKYGDAKAFKVIPGGQRYHDQVTLWYLWEVQMREVDKEGENDSDYSYSCGLNQFFPADYLRDLFSKAFSEINQELLRAECR